MTFKWQDRRWHVRLYLWAEPIVAKFFDTYSLSDGRRSVDTNLCPYMRTLLLWLPLALIVNIATLAMLVYTFIVKPVQVFGLGDIGLTIAVAAVFMTIGAIISWVCGVVGDGLRAAWDKRPKHADDTPGFMQALKVRSKMVHQGICPSITINRTEKTR